MFDLDAPIVRIGGTRHPGDAVRYAPWSTSIMEPEPDQVYRRMRDLAVRSERRAATAPADRPMTAVQRAPQTGRYTA